MGELSKIEWTDNTFNPWWGCVKVSEACRNCYAETFDKRVHGVGNEHWGPMAPRRFFGDKHWAEPRKWDARAEHTGVRERVFCASMADVFEDRDDLVEHRERLWDLIAETPNLDWLLLTKRPENFDAMVPWHEERERFPAWDNVWLGVTAETQDDYNRRVEILCDTPATLRFVSMEPLLEQVIIRGFGDTLPDWFIVGGESGPGARPMHPDWARSVRDQCIELGAAFHFKQWGDMATGDDGLVVRIGKKAAGRELDGRTWDELPPGGFDSN